MLDAQNEEMIATSRIGCIFGEGETPVRLTMASTLAASMSAVVDGLCGCAANRLRM